MSGETEKPVPSKGTDGRFLSGNSGGGRPRGSRNKLSEAFLEALSDDFAAHGKAAITRVREEEPAAYIRTIASLLPKKLELEGDGEPLVPILNVTIGNA